MLLNNITNPKHSLLAEYFKSNYEIFTNKMVFLTGWRYVVFISTIVGVTGAAIYPIIIQPLVDPSYYRKIYKSIAISK